MVEYLTIIHVHVDDFNVVSSHILSSYFHMVTITMYSCVASHVYVEFFYLSVPSNYQNQDQYDRKLFF